MHDRVRALNQAPLRPEAGYVLYRARRNRRVDANEALLHAAARANELGLPLLFLEELSCGSPLANRRRHAFVLEGVEETARRLKQAGIGYCFHLSPKPAGDGAAARALAVNAACVVTDDYPYGVETASGEVLCEAVDASCVVPMRSFSKREYAARTIRPKIQRVLKSYLQPFPALKVKRAWTGAAPAFHTAVTAERIPALIDQCQIDQGVPPAIGQTGGRVEAERRLKVFLEEKLRRYARERNSPAAQATSGLSAHLHFGQIGAREVALAVRDYAEEHRLIAEEFLEELIVRRELSFNFACFASGPDWYAELPEWVRKTLDEHAADPREYVYSYEQFDAGLTHDALWNACQRELRLRGVIHGYYRMYWGKKVLEWSASPREAVDIMVRLHDRYALDGGDPNTYVGILWSLGLHDRPWAKRPVFGVIRYMGLEGMRRKTGVDAYLRAMAQLEEQPCMWP